MKKIILTAAIIIIVSILAHYNFEVSYSKIGMSIVALGILGILAKFGHIRVLDDEGISHYLLALMIMTSLTAVEGFLCEGILCLPNLSGSMFTGIIATILCLISFVTGYSIWYLQIGKRNGYNFGKFLFG